MGFHTRYIRFGNFVRVTRDRRVIRATRMMDLLPLIHRKAIGVIMVMATMATTASGRLG
jgi:hypothetical protein